MHIQIPLPGPSAIFHTWRHRDHTTLPPEGHAGGKGNRHAHKFGNESLQAMRKKTAVQKVGRQAKRPDQSGNSHASVVARQNKPNHGTKRLRAKKWVLNSQTQPPSTNCQAGKPVKRNYEDTNKKSSAYDLVEQHKLYPITQLPRTDPGDPARQKAEPASLLEASRANR